VQSSINGFWSVILRRFSYCAINQSRFSSASLTL
jgi:hypothetical protein